MMTKRQTRRRNENEDYSSIASSATIASTAISSSENNNNNNGDNACDYFPEESSLDSTKNEFLVMDIDEAIDRLGMGMFQFQIVLACGLCFASDAMEYLLLSYLAVVLQSRWALSEGQSDLISSVVFLGALVGTLVLTPLGDKVGRKIIFAVTSSTISLFGILSAFCTTYPQILMVRFLVGFGIGGLTVPYDTLGEFMPNSRRGKNMLSTSFFWISASLMVPLFAWLTVGRNNVNQEEEDSFASWRAFVMLCSLPSVVSTGLGIWFVPESPRWLLTRGKHEQSLAILRQAAAKNGKEPYLAFPEGVRLVDPTNNINSNSAATTALTKDETNGDGIQRYATANETRPQHLKFQSDESSEAIACIESRVTAPTKNDRICSMLSNPQWRKISFLLGVNWYGLTFMYYGAIMAVSIVFSNIQNVDSYNASDNNSDGEAFDFDYWAIFIASSAEIVGLTLAIALVDRVGRVPTQAWAYSLGGFCLLMLGIFDFYAGSDSAINNESETSPRNYLIVFAFLSRMFIMGATAITWLHTAELLPTRFRATGHGLGKFLLFFWVLVDRKTTQNVFDLQRLTKKMYLGLIWVFFLLHNFSFSFNS